MASFSSVLVGFEVVWARQRRPGRPFRVLRRPLGGAHDLPERGEVWAFVSNSRTPAQRPLSNVCGGISGFVKNVYKLDCTC